MRRTTFINKYADSGNVYQSTHEERKLINERNREYRKPRRARKQVEKTDKPREGSVSVAGSSQVHCSTAAPNWSASDSLNIIQSTEIADFDQAAHNDEVHLRSPHPLSGIAELRQGPGSSIDPFNTSSVPPHATVIQLLRYFKEVYYTSLWARIRYTLGGDLCVWGIVQCPPEQVILESLHSRARIHTLLANLGCQLKYEERLDSRVNIYYLIQRGMESFREEFRTNPKIDGDMLCGALHLYLAVSAINQSEAAKAHLAGLRAIVQGIIDQDDRIIKPQAALVALVDVNLSKQLLLNPARVRDKTPKFLGETDVE